MEDQSNKYLQPFYEVVNQIADTYSETSQVKKWEQVHTDLNKYANEFLASRNIVQTDEIEILKTYAIEHAIVNLEMRYMTYAQDSWVALVLKSAEETASCGCDDCQLWHMRLDLIIKEVELVLDQRLTAATQADSHSVRK